MRPARLAKAIGARVGQGFRHRVQRQQLQGLFGPIGVHRNAERAAFSVFLGDVDPSERFWPVVLRIQLVGLSPLAHGGVQQHTIDPRRVFAPIGAHPLHRQEFGGERVGEQALQRPHAVPLAGSDRLHDSRLESADETTYPGPIDCGPGRRPIPRAFNDAEGTHRLKKPIGLSLCRACFVSQDPPEVCPLSGWGKV